MEIRITKFSLIISLAILFIVITIKDQFEILIPLLFLYLIATACMFIFNFLGCQFLKINLNIIYPIAFIVSIFFLIGCLSWLSGNTFLETFELTFLKRKDIITIADPYILGNVITYIVLFKRFFSPNNYM